jgi:hypothetical protein
MFIVTMYAYLRVCRFGKRWSNVKTLSENYPVKWILVMAKSPGFQWHQF